MKKIYPNKYPPFYAGNFSQHRTKKSKIKSKQSTLSSSGGSVLPTTKVLSIPAKPFRNLAISLPFKQHRRTIILSFSLHLFFIS